jgi:hypothetical protein
MLVFIFNPSSDPPEKKKKKIREPRSLGSLQSLGKAPRLSQPGFRLLF